MWVLIGCGRIGVGSAKGQKLRAEGPVASCQLLAANLSKTQSFSTPQGCIILALIVVGITRELVHQHRSLPFATLCLHMVHVRTAEPREEVIFLCLPRGDLCCECGHVQ